MAEKKCPPPGLPAWVMTFADLMSLLMCFFVLLLSFAHMDQVKFREVAGSMQDAFGDDLLAYVPGTLSKMADKDHEMDSEQTKKDDTGERTPGRRSKDLDMSEMKKSLSEEIKAGIITVAEGGGKIAVRVQQQKAFPSGSAGLLKDIEPVLAKLGDVFKNSDATIHVDGHTDNIPISTARYRSNWELSAARAASVAMTLLETKGLDPARMEIRGHADTRPLQPNDNRTNRAMNRRIEIVMDYNRQPTDEEREMQTVEAGDGEQVDSEEAPAAE